MVSEGDNHLWFRSGLDGRLWGLGNFRSFLLGLETEVQNVRKLVVVPSYFLEVEIFVFQGGEDIRESLEIPGGTDFRGAIVDEAVNERGLIIEVGGIDAGEMGKSELSSGAKSTVSRDTLRSSDDDRDSLSKPLEGTFQSGDGAVVVQSEIFRIL